VFCQYGIVLINFFYGRIWVKSITSRSNLPSYDHLGDCHFRWLNFLCSGFLLHKWPYKYLLFFLVCSFFMQKSSNIQLTFILYFYSFIRCYLWLKRTNHLSEIKILLLNYDAFIVHLQLHITTLRELQNTSHLAHFRPSFINRNI